MIRCSRCVMPETRPDTPFVDGVCSACLAYDQRSNVNWVDRGKELRELLDRHRNPNGYDCAVASSGGKDSHYIALTLINMGYRPLLITASTCHLTPIGRKNLDNLARYATTIEVTPNRTVRATLNRLGLELVGDISWPEHASIFTTPFRIAAQLGIPLLFYGECPQEAYGGPAGSETQRQMDGRWVSEFGGFLGLRATDLVGHAGLTKRDLEDYRLPKPELMDKVTAYFLGQFIEWDSHRNTARATTAGLTIERPSQANLWAAENLDNAQTGIHDHMMYRKYGYGRLCTQASVDVRYGLISRDTALDLVQKADGLFPYKYASVNVIDVLARINLTIEKLDQALDTFTNWPLFNSTVNRRPILKD